MSSPRPNLVVASACDAAETSLNIVRKTLPLLDRDEEEIEMAQRLVEEAMDSTAALREWATQGESLDEEGDDA